MKHKRVLTGITTSGIPHLGNYAGAIRPAVQASRQSGVDAFYFLADYHALIKTSSPARVAESRIAIAATWLASGLDPEQVTFYRQSDIPEIPELCWILTCLTPKGLMNRAHAYKALIDINTAAQVDVDDGINMGLFSYPILMAADILLFNAHQVPVGRDQIQHLEMARDIAQRFHHQYGADTFVLPEAAIEESVALLPGLDGRKMSKSYDNTIPLFEGTAKTLKDSVAKIVTDSKLPGEPKSTENCALFTLYQAFANPQQCQQLQQALAEGMSWAEAKQELVVVLEQEIAPKREHYQSLLAKPELLEEILQAGAQKARAIATPFLHEIRHLVGLRSFVAPVAHAKSTKPAAPKAPRVITYKEGTGFHFRIVAPDGASWMESTPFPDGKTCGQYVKQTSQTLDWLNVLSVEGGKVVWQEEGNVIAQSAVVSQPQTLLGVIREAFEKIAPDQG